MSSIPPLAILLFGIALGACLPLLVTALHGRMRSWMRTRPGSRWFGPPMLRLDDVPSRQGRPSLPPGDAQP